MVGLFLQQSVGRFSGTPLLLWAHCGSVRRKVTLAAFPYFLSHCVSLLESLCIAFFMLCTALLFGTYRADGRNASRRQGTLSLSRRRVCFALSLCCTAWQLPFQLILTPSPSVTMVLMQSSRQWHWRSWNGGACGGAAGEQ